jgi:hypothetical protein
MEINTALLKGGKDERGFSRRGQKFNWSGGVLVGKHDTKDNDAKPFRRYQVTR